MSNRSLIELNHDNSHEMDGPEFVDALQRYLASASPENAARLEFFGVRVFGMRHHSDSFDINWGGYKMSEPASSKW